jgi:uncharacterized protein (UPF0335 family)
MTDTSTKQIGGNQATEDLRQHAREVTKMLNEISDLQDEVKAKKAELKSDGYDMKAFNQIVKEMRRGAEFQAQQLELELVLDTYRKAVDLPVTLEDAQKRAAEAAEELPSDDEEEADEAPTARRTRSGGETLQ